MPDIAELLNTAWAFRITVGEWWLVVAVAALAGFAAGRLGRD